MAKSFVCELEYSIYFGSSDSFGCSAELAATSTSGPGEGLFASPKCYNARDSALFERPDPRMTDDSQPCNKTGGVQDEEKHPWVLGDRMLDRDDFAGGGRADADPLLRQQPDRSTESPYEFYIDGIRLNNVGSFRFRLNEHTLEPFDIFSVGLPSIHADP
jgi:hypothetical protein